MRGLQILLINFNVSFTVYMYINLNVYKYIHMYT